MKNRLLASFALAAILLVAGSPVFGHHGRQAYDNSKRVTIKGTITEFQWRNPHSQLYVDAKDDKGNVVNWGIELSSPGNLTERGVQPGVQDVAWTKDALKPGGVVTVSFNPTKNGTPFGLCADIVRADGVHLSDCARQ